MKSVCLHPRAARPAFTNMGFHPYTDVLKGHHGPVWSIAFSPDGRLYATGSEDGTIKMWKNCEGFYGLWKGASGASLDRPAE